MPRPIANPKNRFAQLEVVYEDGQQPDAALEVYEDDSRSIVAKNDSPDLGFNFSVNPYRGCYHGCAYCYARPTHEYLSMGAGTDFDRKLLVKPKAKALLQAFFDKPSWTGELIMFSGVTDCYQPLEAQYQLTRQCLELCVEYHQPVSVITKAPLIERDLDVLLKLHERTHVSVAISIPIWNAEEAHLIEPYVATPQRRMQTVKRLADAGLDVAVNVAPMIPTVGDRDLKELLEAAKDAGATRAHTILLRLPGAVKQVFEERLKVVMPDRAEHVLSRIRDARSGKLYDSSFGKRQTGEGPYAETLGAVFQATVKRLGLDGPRRSRPSTPTTFRRPSGPQLSLF